MLMQHVRYRIVKYNFFYHFLTNRQSFVSSNNERKKYIYVKIPSTKHNICIFKLCLINGKLPRNKKNAFVIKRKTEQHFMEKIIL